MKEMMNDANDLAQTFQFLIGTVLRKGKNHENYGNWFQFLIGTVLQQCSRRFPALSSFFLLKSH